jgi:hypothetical protein
VTAGPSGSTNSPHPSSREEHFQNDVHARRNGEAL